MNNTNIGISNHNTRAFRGIACNLSKAMWRSHKHKESFDQINGKFLSMKKLLQDSADWLKVGRITATTPYEAKQFYWGVFSIAPVVKYVGKYQNCKISKLQTT